MEQVPAFRVYRWLSSAGGDLRKLAQAKVRHKVMGLAIIRTVVEQSPHHNLELQFQNGQTRAISWKEFRDIRHWEWLVVQPDIAREIEASIADLGRLPEQKEFESLKTRFNVRSPDYIALPSTRSGPVWRLFALFKKIEIERDWLAPPETLDWLEGKQMHGILAELYQRRFTRTRDAWDAARCSRYYRLIDDPKSAVAVTNSIAQQPGSFGAEAVAAALTSRAAALRTLRRYTDSETALRIAYAYGGRSEHIARAWGLWTQSGIDAVVVLAPTVPLLESDYHLADRLHWAASAGAGQPTVTRTGRLPAPRVRDSSR
jgi:hypothetical protein